MSDFTLHWVCIGFAVAYPVLLGLALWLTRGWRDQGYID